MSNGMLRSSNRTRPTSNQSPNTKDDARNNFVKQILNLQKGQALNLDIEPPEDKTDKHSIETVPDFHDSGTQYTVMGTVVKTDEGSEYEYQVYLASDQVGIKTDPIFKLRCKRNGAYNDDDWRFRGIELYVGKNTWGNEKYTDFVTPHDGRALKNITVVENVECCPECGKPY